MPRLFLSVVWWLLALAMAGCDISQPESATSTQQSKYSVDQVFKDPKAQALALAAEQGNAAEVTRLMKQEHVNPDVIFSDDDNGMPLVAWPVFTLSPAGLKAMLEDGANPNARKPGTHTKKYEDGSGGTYFDYDNAMVWAAKQSDSSYLKLLLDHGGDPNTRNGNDESLLFQAFIWHDQWQNVQLLVERGARVNGEAGMAGSILKHYTASASFDKAYWLLEHGADPVGDAIPAVASSPARYPIVEDIFWYPSKPVMTDWQRKCQQWLLQHGYKRPPMTDYYRKLRRDFGFPYDEKDIPLL